MSEDVKAKDVVLTLVYVALGILAITAAVWLFMPISYGTPCFFPVDELEEGVEIVKITDEVLAEYPMLVGPPESLAVYDSVFSQIFSKDERISSGLAREIHEKFGSKYLDYNGKYYVIGLLVE